jgi:tRNA-methyltransferase O
MIHERYELQPIGWVESSLADPAGAPKQGDEGSPDAWLVFDPRFREALRDLQVGADLVVLTWLHRAQRDVLVVHPRGDSAKPLKGVFATRSEDRPKTPSDCTPCGYSLFREPEFRSATSRRSMGRRSSTSSQSSVHAAAAEALVG